MRLTVPGGPGVSHPPTAMSRPSGFPFIVRRPNAPSPLLVHIPHSATVIPPEVRPSLLLDDDALAEETRVLTDRHTDRLFGPAAGGTVVVYGISRLVVDPERFTDDNQEVMAERGMGVIYTQTSRGALLRHPPAEPERRALLATYYSPYHAAIEGEVDRLLEMFGRCVVLDAHSFPSRPLPCDLDQDPDRPDVCIGTDDDHTPEALAALVEDFCRDRGLCARRNRPYSGTFVPAKHQRRDARVTAIMVEVNRRLYMDERTAKRTASFPDMQRVLSNLGDRIEAWSLST